MYISVSSSTIEVLERLRSLDIRLRMLAPSAAAFVVKVKGLSDGMDISNLVSST